MGMKASKRDGVGLEGLELGEEVHLITLHDPLDKHAISIATIEVLEQLDEEVGGEFEVASEGGEGAIDVVEGHGVAEADDIIGVDLEPHLDVLHQLVEGREPDRTSTEDALAQPLQLGDDRDLLTA